MQDATRVASVQKASATRSVMVVIFDGKSSNFNNNPQLTEEFNTANTWYISQFGKAIEKMKSLKEYDGSSVFDHSVLMFGSGLGHGGNHFGPNLPIVFAGGM